MNKPQTYYAIVSVDTPPLKDGFYHVKVKDSMGNVYDGSVWFTKGAWDFEEHFSSKFSTACSVTRWLSEQKGIILSVEEFEAVKNAEQVLKDVNKAIQNSNMKDTVLHVQVKQALSQLNN